MLRPRTWVVAMALLTSGCLGGTETSCVGWKPIFTSSSDKLTPGTARQVLDHNEYGERVCHWKPPGG